LAGVVAAAVSEVVSAVNTTAAANGVCQRIGILRLGGLLPTETYPCQQHANNAALLRTS
jgi:hypothetical protein